MFPQSLFNRLNDRFLRLSNDEMCGLKKCLELLKKHRGQFFFLIFSSLGLSFFEIGTMAVVILAINIIIEGDVSSVIPLAAPFGSSVVELILARSEGQIFLSLVAAAVILQVGKSALQYICSALGIRLGIHVTRDLQSQISDKIMDVSYPTIARYASGHLSSLITISGATPRIIITNVFANGLLCTLLIVVYTGLMFSLSISLTVYALLIAGLFLIAMRTIASQLETLGGRQTLRTLSAGRLTIDYLNMPKLLRVFNVQEDVKKKLDSARLKILETNQSSALLIARVDPGIQAVTMVGLGFFLIGGYVFAGDSFKTALPGLLMFLIIFNRLMPQIRALNSAWLNFANNKKSLGILGAFLDSEQTNLNRTLKALMNPPNSIVFESVSLTYPGKMVPAVRDISFELRKGKMVALVGPSGSGKTSIADLLTGLYEPTEGKILVDGVSLGDIDHREWVRRLGVVDQGVELLATTIRDNILFARSRFSDEDVLRAAKNASVDEFVDMLEKKYATYIGPKGFQLSGGQRQRIALARALLGEPPLLVLDEATSALDTKSERLINQTLRAWRKNHAILVIAHRLSSVIDADEILVLDSGKVIERGSFGDLMRADGAFVEAWNLQTSKSESE